MLIRWLFSTLSVILSTYEFMFYLHLKSYFEMLFWSVDVILCLQKMAQVFHN